MARFDGSVLKRWERDPRDPSGLWVYALDSASETVYVGADTQPLVLWDGPYTDRLRLECTGGSGFPGLQTLQVEVWSQSCETDGVRVVNGLWTFTGPLVPSGLLAIVRGWPSYSWMVRAAVVAGNAPARVQLRATVDRVGGDPSVSLGMLV